MQRRAIQRKTGLVAVVVAGVLAVAPAAVAVPLPSIEAAGQVSDTTAPRTTTPPTTPVTVPDTVPSTSPPTVPATTPDTTPATDAAPTSAPVAQTRPGVRPAAHPTVPNTAPPVTTTPAPPTTIAGIGDQVTPGVVTIPLRTTGSNGHVDPVFAWLSGVGFALALLLVAIRLFLTRSGGRDRAPLA